MIPNKINTKQNHTQQNKSIKVTNPKNKSFVCGKEGGGGGGASSKLSVIHFPIKFQESPDELQGRVLLFSFI